MSQDDESWTQLPVFVVAFAGLLDVHPTPTKLRDFLVRNPATFNKMLHNARPDTIEIQDIVGYHIFLQRKVGEYVDAMMETETEDGRG